MKRKLLILLRIFACVAVTFIFIYLFVFLWGHKLFESGDPILIELGASVVIGGVVFLFLHLYELLYKKYEELEKRLKELEKRKR